MSSVLSFVSKYSIFFLIALIILVLAITLLLAKAVIGAIRDNLERKNQKVDIDVIKNTDYTEESEDRKGLAIRRMVCANGIDTAPNSYMSINDGGRDVYVRSFTISKLPSRTTFANTFSELMDFPNCTSSVYVNPISEAEMSKKLNKHITVVDSEFVGAAGNPNRRRQLQNQYVESMNFAREIETGDNKFYNVGFLFSIYADSISELNNISDNFRSIALKKGIEISSCYAAQAEAYVTNAPFNKVKAKSSIMDSNCVKFFMMDKYSVSTIYNYKESTFSHRTGILLGNDLNTGKPFVYDLYNHKSFIGICYGSMGYGKSATIKMIATRASLAGYRFAAVDSQTLKGTNGGEYNPLCRKLNGTVFQLSSDSDNVLNLFDVSISKTRDMKEDSLLGGVERDTLDLNSKIQLIEDNLLTIIQKTKEINDTEYYVRMGTILKDTCQEVYEEKGIFHGNPSSLYEEVTDGITTGKVLKQLPTLTDFYKRILRKSVLNDDSSLDKCYNLIIDGLSDYVRPICFTKISKTPVSEEIYNNLIPNADGIRVLGMENGTSEEVVCVRGTSTYFDGQSTISRDYKSPFINIDISQLPEGPKKVIARQIAISWINECVINKNSEDIKSADKLMIIFDEAHENFKFQYGRSAIEKIVRTARKRNVAMIISTQTISEFDESEETRAIRDLASFHFIFAQPVSEKEVLKKQFGLTDSQIDTIINRLGTGGSNATPEEIAAHQGELCVYDKEVKRCCFIKVAYFKNQEAAVVETKAENVEALYKKNA